MVQHHQAPIGAVVPQRIPDGGLWKLDIDDSIWQDVGLDEQSDGSPPPWLAHEPTRAGIRALLDYDRACEEEARLLRERQALQDWMLEEWQVVQTAIERTGKCTPLLPPSSLLTLVN